MKKIIAICCIIAVFLQVIGFTTLAAETEDTNIKAESSVSEQEKAKDTENQKTPEDDSSKPEEKSDTEEQKTPDDSGKPEKDEDESKTDTDTPNEEESSTQEDVYIDDEIFENEETTTVISDSPKEVPEENKEGNKIDGWTQNEKGQWLYYKNGVALTYWQKLKWSSGESWFYFDKDGIMQTGWKNDTSGWMGEWFYFDSNGVMATGWKNDTIGWAGKWFYFDGNGVMTTGWKGDIPNWVGKWFYFESNGVMATGWKNDTVGWDNEWFYFESNGVMATGWKNDIPSWEGKWFYFDSNGVMATGWRNIGNVNYYFLSNGVLLDENSSAYVPNVPMVLQKPELPAGCEATSLTMILNYLGYAVSKEEVARDYLPQSDDFSDGHGPDFRIEFAGTPFSNWGYGCYHEAIVRTANNYFSANNVTTRNITDFSGNGVEQVYDQLNSGKPVIVWATINMKQPSITTGWYVSTGEYLNWINGEHCLVIIGYNKDTVTMNDPLVGVVNYPRALFEQRFSDLGKQAIVIE